MEEVLESASRVLEQFRNYCGLIKIARCGFLWEKTTKRPIASVYTNCETALGRCLGVLCSAIVCFSSVTVANAQRPPAVPLVTHDPYFSIWSMSDRLTDVNTRHWTGLDQPLTGLVRIDNTLYRFMGLDPRQVPAMQQISLRVTPLHTVYVFEAAGVQLEVRFFTAALPQDLEALSRPVDYLTWKISSSDGRPHSVSVLLDVNPRVAVNTDDEEVTWGRSKLPGMEVLRVGSRDQRVLSRGGDNLRIDWGYFYLAVPDQADTTLVTSSSAISAFLASGELPQSDDMEMPRQPREGASHLAVRLRAEVSGDKPVSRHVLLAYDEADSIEYLDRKLPPYWRRNGRTAGAMLAESEAQYASLEERGNRFDEELTTDLEHAGGKSYAELGTLAYRQTLAAHGFVADVDNTPMLFPKENFSNGCISTVDVLYPSAPFFLLFNPALLEAQLKPVLEYSALPRWRWPFAPHDLGTFPLADGQVYGGGELTAGNQMPVEESGNLLIMVAALGRRQGNWDSAQRYMPKLTEWAAYLANYGVDPAEQLSTDDFAGHLAHNANLSVKAIEALGAFAQIARGVGDDKLATHYESLTKKMPAEWERMARDGDHYKLAFDQPGTWSQKYNLVWDDLLGLHLFPKKLMQTEWAFYAKQMQSYGLPLDNRKSITKPDWEVWPATLASDDGQYRDLIH